MKNKITIGATTILLLGGAFFMGSTTTDNVLAQSSIEKIDDSTFRKTDTVEQVININELSVRLSELKKNRQTRIDMFNRSITSLNTEITSIEDLITEAKSKGIILEE